MGRPNYAFAKRQRDLANKQKKDEKRLRKVEASQRPPEDAPATPTGDGAAEVVTNDD